MTVVHKETVALSVGEIDDRAAPAVQPRALIVTIYGAYAREAGGWLSVAALVRLMAAVGVAEPAVRSSISRLKRREILVATRVDGAAGYALSDPARAMLAEGDERIFGRRTARLEDGWVLAVFSVPENERARRHTLRSRLAWLGFGTVAPGVWIAPAHLTEEAHDVLGRLGLANYVDLFSGQYLAFADLAGEVEQWWNLDQLQQAYAAYIDTWRPVLEQWRRRRRSDGARAFADYVHTLTAWRRLPYLDPGLPRELLPGGWKGGEAADLFFDLRRRLEEPAHDYLVQIRG